MIQKSFIVFLFMFVISGVAQAANSPSASCSRTEVKITVGSDEYYRSTYSNVADDGGYTLESYGLYDPTTGLLWFDEYYNDYNGDGKPYYNDHQSATAVCYNGLGKRLPTLAELNNLRIAKALATNTRDGYGLINRYWTSTDQTIVEAKVVAYRAEGGLLTEAPHVEIFRKVDKSARTRCVVQIACN